MSVGIAVITVLPMLSAPTLLVALTVPATKDTEEVELHAQVKNVILVKC